MDIEVSEAAYVDDLIASLRSAGLIASRTGLRKIEAYFALPRPENAAGLELDAYLQVWEARRQNAWATRVSP